MPEKASRVIQRGPRARPVTAGSSSAVLRRARSRCLSQPGGLVLDLDRDLGPRICVLAIVMRAEQQLPRPRKHDADISLGATPVTHIEGVERLRWGYSSGHVASFAWTPRTCWPGGPYNAPNYYRITTCSRLRNFHAHRQYARSEHLSVSSHGPLLIHCSAYVVPGRRVCRRRGSAGLTLPAASLPSGPPGAPSQGETFVTVVSSAPGQAVALSDGYTARHLTVLEGLEAVRKRPGMYIGSTDGRGLLHCLWEIIDNAVDEALAGVCTDIEIVLHADHSAEVRDNGRGIPVDVEPKTGLTGVELVMTRLHAGGKFGGGSYTASGGLHGVGASVVNALSGRLDVQVDRNGHEWVASFRRGVIGEFSGPDPDAPFKPGQGLRKMRRVAKTLTGTRIRFWPDSQIFVRDAQWSFEALAQRARQTAYLVPGLSIKVRGDPLVAHLDAEPRHQVGRLPGPLGERLEAPLRVPHEDLAVRPEPDPRAGQRLGYPAHLAQPLAGLERRIRVGPAELADDAPSEARDPLVPVPVHLHVQTAGQRVHHRGAHAVQPAGCRVGPAAELPARMQPRHHALDAGQPGFRLNVDRDAAAVVPHLGRVIRVQHDLDVRADPGQRLVHGVVDDLPEAVQQAAAIGGADVHSRALADRLQPFQHRQMTCGIAIGEGYRLPGR